METKKHKVSIYLSDAVLNHVLRSGSMTNRSMNYTIVSCIIKTLKIPIKDWGDGKRKVATGDEGV